MDSYSFYVGIGAGICTAVCMLPQLVKIIRSKKAEDLSYAMVVVMISGISAWIWYGILKKDLPIIITNGFSLLVNVIILFYSIRYKE